MRVQATDPIWGLSVGEVKLKTHSPGQCSGEFCSIHNPSNHPLRNAPQNWRSDRGLMERICNHGIGHPDPDDIAHKLRIKGARFADGEATHGCDGCCHE